MLSNAQSKYIRSLTQQKYRKQYNVFTVEGDKIAREWLSYPAPVQIIAATNEWASTHGKLVSSHPEAELVIVTENELERLSSLQTPNQALLVVPFPAQKDHLPLSGWCLAVENLQDPGNMGTIIRIADWFGISDVIASPGSVDFYNPKVIQASMGGHLRVQLHNAELGSYIPTFNAPVYAATLHGKSIYEADKKEPGIILIGNESKGLSEEIIKLATHAVTIPRIGGAESLNAAVSVGIICAMLAGR